MKNWWLRTPGRNQGLAMKYQEAPLYGGISIHTHDTGVRPAIKVKLNG